MPPSACLDERARGAYLIAVTPFAPDGALDLDSADSMVDFYLRHGATGLTLLGVLGEAPKLTQDEARRFTARVVERVAGRVPVVCGVSAPGFAAMRELAAALRDAGAPLAELPTYAWAERARARLADPDIAMAYVSLGRVHTPGPRLAPYDLFLATGADFDVARTAGLLAELGLSEPPPRRELLARIVAGALRAELA